MTRKKGTQAIGWCIDIGADLKEAQQLLGQVRPYHAGPRAQYWNHLRVAAKKSRELVALLSLAVGR